MEIYDIKSEYADITCGVPQGSILGPILFLIYIHDIGNSSKLNLLSFADNTTLYQSGDNYVTLVQPKKAAKPLVLPVVALTRSQAGCAPALTLPVNDDINSQVDVDPDMLSGRVMESSTQVLLEVVPFVDRDGCPTGWLETEIDDNMMEKFVLVPEMSLIGSVTSAAVPTFLPALSEVCSLAVLAGGRCSGKPPGSGRVRYSASVCPTGCRKRTSDGDEFFSSAGCRSD